MPEDWNGYEIDDTGDENELQYTFKKDGEHVYDLIWEPKDRDEASGEPDLGGSWTLHEPDGSEQTLPASFGRDDRDEALEAAKDLIEP